MITPFEDSALYDHIEFGAVESPGKVTITGHDREIGWDVKEGAGQAGATTTRKGEKPSEFTCSFYLADKEDFDDWPAFLEEVKSTIVGAKPVAKDIYHPDLEEVGIKSACLKKIGGTVHDGKGGQTKSIVFIEYKPPKPAKGTASGSKTAKGPDPNAAALAELAALTKQYEATPWG